MLKLLSTIILVLLTSFCNAQGSWDIGYVPVDTINTQHIGQIVRIDFKSNSSLINSDSRRSIRSYVGKKDTGTLTVDTTLFLLAERRKIYVDHGSYSDQYLECINCNEEAVLIYDAKILGVDTRSIQFLLDIETKAANQSIKKESKTVRIDRSSLDGVMYRQ
jgi:hypothetical protein